MPAASFSASKFHGLPAVLAFRRSSATPLLNEPDRHRVAVELPFARLDGGDDDEDGIQHPEDGEEDETDQDEAKDAGDKGVDEHRDLEVERFLAVGIDLGRVAALD